MPKGIARPLPTGAALEALVDACLELIQEAPGGHWVWTGPTSWRGGTPRLPVGHDEHRPARAVLFTAVVRPLAVGERAVPVCGVAACVRPEHLAAVPNGLTRTRNVTPLTGDQVARAKELFDAGARPAAVARDLGVHYRTAGDLGRGFTHGGAGEATRHKLGQRL